MLSRSLPLRLVLRQVDVEGYTKSLQEIGDGPLLTVAECKTKRKLLRLAYVQLRGKCDVSVAGAVEFPIHLKVVVQVSPSITGANVPAGKMRKRHGGAQCHPPTAFLRHQNASSPGKDRVASVACAAYLQMWGAQGEEFEVREKRFVFASDERALEQAGSMWTRYSVFRNGIAAIMVRIDATIAEHMVSDALHLDGKMALLFVKESLAVRNQVLKVANLRPVDGRVIHLRDDAVPDREPQMAGGGVGCTDASLVAMCPAWLVPRFPKGFLAANFLHCDTSLLSAATCGLDSAAYARNNLRTYPGHRRVRLAVSKGLR